MAIFYEQILNTKLEVQIVLDTPIAVLDEKIFGVKGCIIENQNFNGTGGISIHAIFLSIIILLSPLSLAVYFPELILQSKFLKVDFQYQDFVFRVLQFRSLFPDLKHQ